ncbi:MAG: hypothetical protein ACC656_09515, partial [Candidatus Heimdallarchaeota archaeon]
MPIKNSLSLESNYTVGMGLRSTNNSKLASENKLDELSINTVFDLNVYEDAARINYSISPRILLVDYTKNTYEDRTYYGLEADVNLIAIPSFFTWNINENLSVQDIVNTGSNVPTNKQQVSIFRTGPSISYNINSTNIILLDYVYARVKNEITNTDNKRDYYSFIFNHGVSNITNLSLNYNNTSIQYDDSIANENVKVEELFIDFTGRKSHSDYSFAFGENKVKRLSDSKTFNGDLIRISWDYKMNSTSSVFTSYRKEISDPINDINISNGLVLGGVRNTANQTNSRVFDAERLFLSFTKNSSNTLSVFSLYNDQQEYEITTSNQDTYGSIFSMEYSLSSLVTITGYASRSETTLNSSIEEVYDDTSLSFGTIFRFSKNIDLIALYSNNNRNSTLTNNDYDENVVLLSFVYSKG